MEPTTLPPARTPDPASILARDAFLRRYAGETRKLYGTDLRLFFDWCGEQELYPLAARRLHLEEFAEHLAAASMEGQAHDAVTAHRVTRRLRQF